MSILNIYMPANAGAVFEKMLNLASADLIPDFIMMPWYDWVANMSTHMDDDLSSIFNQRFYQMGYDTTNLLLNF